MPNITLSLDKQTYEKMREHDEIRWSRFVRKSIQNHIATLETLKPQENILTMLASQQILEEDWDNQYDAQWDHI